MFISSFLTLTQRGSIQKPYKRHNRPKPKRDRSAINQLFILKRLYDMKSPGKKPGPFHHRGVLYVLNRCYPSNANFKMNARARTYISGLIFFMLPVIRLIRT